MVDISAETWNKAEVAAINILENDKAVLLLLCISDSSKWWGGKNLYDLIDKEIKGKYRAQKISELSKPQLRKYKIDRSRLHKGSKYSMYVHEDILIPIIKQSKWSDSKTINFRAVLRLSQINLILKKGTISSNTTTKSFLCRKSKAAAQILKKRKSKNWHVFFWT